MERVGVVEGLGKYHRRIFTYFPENLGVKQVVYFHGMPGDASNLVKKLRSYLNPLFRVAETGLVILEVEDWNRDLSPWPAEGIFRKGEGFPGGGKAYLEDLCGQVIPEIEERYAVMSSVQRRIIGGYSMGGLFALYAMMESPIFTDMISVSGSLWYEGIVEYVSEKAAGGGKMSGLQECLRREGECFAGRGRAYFSLGQREPKTRNPAMRRVGEQTAAIVELMAQTGFSVYFQWNPGNHFQDELKRMEHSIRFMLDGGQ